MKKNQIRKSVAALAMAVVVGVSLLGYGCGSKPASTAGGVSGDFTGTAKGMGGDVTVTLTLEDGKITGCTAEGKDETPGIGTLALEDPARFAALCHACPGRIGVSLDAENGRLKTRGWVGDTPYTVDDVVPRLAEDGAAFLVYTDIERDGMQTGVNVPALTHLARTSKVPVIAAGGVATLDDVKALYPLSVSANLEGAISGRAIYEGTLDLREAMGWIAAQER